MRDELILRKIKKGDPSGLEELMDRYIPYVSAVVWNILRYAMTPEDAEEVVSDVFLAAWAQAPDILPNAVKPWLGAWPGIRRGTNCVAGGSIFLWKRIFWNCPVRSPRRTHWPGWRKRSWSAGRWTA